MLSEATMKSKYQKLQKIGEGAYGCVYKAMNKLTKQIVALKVIKIDDDEEGIPSTTLREITILKSVNHQNIVKYTQAQERLLDVDIQVENQKLYQVNMVFEFIAEDLSKHIRRIKNFSENTVKNYFRQILAGVYYLHQHKIIHRDLKPQNILISEDGIIKIADFGLGRIYNQPFRTMSKQIQTLWYRSPELLLGWQKYDLSVDTWSLGCIFYQIAENSKIMFHSESQIELIFKIFQYHGYPNESDWPQVFEYPYFRKTFPKFRKTPKQFINLSADGIDLLNKLVALNPKNRITISQALKHPYFKL